MSNCRHQLLFCAHLRHDVFTHLLRLCLVHQQLRYSVRLPLQVSWWAWSVVNYEWSCTGDAQPYHFLSRYFAPWQGIAEDAVTGAAHTALGPHWAAQLNMFGQPMQARQCSKRGGDLQVTVQKGSKQLLLATYAVVVGSSHLNLANIVESGTEAAGEPGAASLLKLAEG